MLNHDTRILLLEGIHPNAVTALKQAGFARVELRPAALEGAALAEALQNADVVGIRSRTQLTAEVLQAAPHLKAVGCFCIGTNQVALEAAQLLGIPVFNAPYSNTRSVAELVLAEIICLLRGLMARNQAVHGGQWPKDAKGACEARGKTLGIIGYGNIGAQLSVLAENLGMRVIFYDIQSRLPLGNAEAAPSLDALLAQADVVSLHVPETPDTRDLIGARELYLMKPGAMLVNAARGQCVVIDDLAEALTSGHIAGAALDVFPVEPKGGNEPLDCPLRGMENVILTPHIGGSTIEAQADIGRRALCGQPPFRRTRHQHRRTNADYQRRNRLSGDGRGAQRLASRAGTTQKRRRHHPQPHHLLAFGKMRRSLHNAALFGTH